MVLASGREPTCIASSTEDEVGIHEPDGHFSDAEWSADGSSLCTRQGNGMLKLYTLHGVPLAHTDRDDGAPQNKAHLRPYRTCKATESIYATSLFPGFNCTSPETTVQLISQRDSYISLVQLLYTAEGISEPDRIASYPLVDANTEEVQAPTSLTWCSDGTRFVAGGKSRLAVFDATCYDQPPVSLYFTHTVPSRKKRRGVQGYGILGSVSALGINRRERILAAGTWNREFALYEDEGDGEIIATFKFGNDDLPKGYQGQGITQLEWSSCGKYLYVAERKSNGVMLYDLRVTGKRLGWLCGREAITQQRLKIDVKDNIDGHEVWAGGVDGTVKRWDNPYQSEGPIDTDFQWQAHDDAVPAVSFHPTLSIAATCSGQRHLSAGDEESVSDSDDSSGLSNQTTATEECWENGVKLWTY